MKTKEYEDIIRGYLKTCKNLTTKDIIGKMKAEGYHPSISSVQYVLGNIRMERKIPYKYLAQGGYVYNYIEEVKSYDPRDKLDPCPHCGNEYVEMYVNRMKVSYIKCHCGAKFEIDCTHCSDPPVENLVMSLFRGWNRRYSGMEENRKVIM